MKTYRIAFAVAGALAIPAIMTPIAAQGQVVGQVVDPLEDRRVRDDGDVFGDAVFDRRALRGRLDPGQENVSGNGRAGGQAAAAANENSTGRNAIGGVLFHEISGPFSAPPDPLRDPLRDPLAASDLDAGLLAPRAAADASLEGEGEQEDIYAALGVRWGSFLLFPEISVESVFDDNLFLSSSGKDADWALELTPGLRAQSAWSRHSLIATLGAERSYHERFTGENDETYSASLSGRIDIRQDTNLVAEASYSQSLEDRSSSDFPAGAAGRAKTRNQGVSLEGNHSFNRVTLTLRGELDEEDFEDGTDAGGSVINNDDRDFTERRVTARASYELRPGVAAFAEASVNERDFAESVDDDGTRNGSSGHDLQAGLSFELTGKLTGEISAGYATQTPDETRLSDIDGLIFNASLEWRASGLTTLRFDASSEVDETTQANSAGSIVRAAALSLEHRPRRNITLEASLGYEREEFAGSGVVDEEYVFGLTGEYSLNRSAALTAAYSYLDSISSTPGSDYSVNELRLGVRLRR